MIKCRDAIASKKTLNIVLDGVVVVHSARVVPLRLRPLSADQSASVSKFSTQKIAVRSSETIKIFPKFFLSLKNYLAVKHGFSGP